MSICVVVALIHRLMKEENKAVARKLGLATGLMFTLPIIVFYIGLYLFDSREHPDNWAGALSIITVNLIVGGYVYSAFSEEDDLDTGDDDDDGDSKAPRTGIFKKRTD